MPANNREPNKDAGELGVNPETLWQAADKLRGSIDAAEYKHVVLGLIFLKYISDSFEARRAKLAEELAAEGIEGKQAENLLEDRDEYTAELQECFAESDQLQAKIKKNLEGIGYGL